MTKWSRPSCWENLSVCVSIPRPVPRSRTSSRRLSEVKAWETSCSGYFTGFHRYSSHSRSMCVGTRVETSGCQWSIGTFRTPLPRPSSLSAGSEFTRNLHFMLTNTEFLSIQFITGYSWFHWFQVKSHIFRVYLRLEFSYFVWSVLLDKGVPFVSGS